MAGGHKKIVMISRVIASTSNENVCSVGWLTGGSAGINVGAGIVSVRLRDRQ